MFRTTTHVLCDATAHSPSLGLTGDLVRQMGTGGTASEATPGASVWQQPTLAPVDSGHSSVPWQCRDCPPGSEPPRVRPPSLLGALGLCQCLLVARVLIFLAPGREAVGRERPGPGAPGSGWAERPGLAASRVRHGVPAQERARQSPFLSSSC